MARSFQTISKEVNGLPFNLVKEKLRKQFEYDDKMMASVDTDISNEEWCKYCLAEEIHNKEIVMRKLLANKP